MPATARVPNRQRGAGRLAGFQGLECEKAVPKFDQQERNGVAKSKKKKGKQDDKKKGEEVEVVTPSGKIKYKIKQIQHK